MTAAEHAKVCRDAQQRLSKMAGSAKSEIVKWCLYAQAIGAQEFANAYEQASHEERGK